MKKCRLVIHKAIHRASRLISFTSDLAMRLAILSMYPIQYHTQWYCALAEHPALEICVYYCHRVTPVEQANAGFGVEFDWDVPLLSGYPYAFLHNVAKPPHTKRFGGMDTPEIKDIIRQHKYDAVMVAGWNYKSAWQAIRACWESGVKVMVRSDSHLHTWRPLPMRVAKRFAYRQFIPRFDACLAAGSWSREYFLHYGAKPEKVFLVPHAVDNSFFQSQAEALAPHRSELREDWGLDREAVVFAFVGKFIAKKHPMDFVRALERAARERTGIQGLMVGDGPLRSECEHYVQTHRVPIRFTGFLNQSRIASAYVACDAVVLPSDGGETWGLVVNEAMASGRPCIVSDRVGCWPDLILPDQTGAIFPLGDVDALAKSVVRMAQPACLLSMGVQSRRRIQDYSVPVAADAVVNCLEAVLGLGSVYARAN